MSLLTDVRDATYQRVCESREFFDLYVEEVRKVAFQSGAEAMREAAMQAFNHTSMAALVVHNLPDPEDKP